MAYESASYINQLDKNLPRGSDSVSEGDIHLRTIKDVLKNSFPNVDEAVNAIHTRDTEPPLHSAGTVWFDTSSGLIKLRSADNTTWINMAHGASTGLGSLLRADWFQKSDDVVTRSEEFELVDEWEISPLSANSTYLISMSFTASVWSYDARQELHVKLRDITTDIDIAPEVVAIGYQHVSDAGNFETKGLGSIKERYANHPAGIWKLGVYAKVYDAEGGGGTLGHLRAEVMEIE